MKKNLPSQRSIQQVARKLFESSIDQDKFITSILNPIAKPTALIWKEDPLELNGIEFLTPPKIFPNWVTLVSPESSPGKLPEHVQGKYYCLDPSSVFAMLPLLELSKDLIAPLSIIDLCASPGGKSIFAQRALRPESLVCNETVGNRIPALLSNLKRFGLTRAKVTQSDPAHLAATNPNTADVIIVDAPCSGQSLLTKFERGLGCFSKPVINANVGRQRRILAEASKLLRPGGYLLYSTCTFSTEENEGNIRWFLKNFSDFSKLSSSYDWPFDGVGAGSFNALLKKSSDEKSEKQEFDFSSIRNWEIFELA